MRLASRQHRPMPRAPHSLHGWDGMRRAGRLALGLRHRRAASFWLFCAAMFFGGAYAAVVFSLPVRCSRLRGGRTAATGALRVMAGGVFAGVIGPQLVTHTMNLWPQHLFAATFLAQAAVAALAAVVLLAFGCPDRPGLTSRGVDRLP